MANCIGCIEAHDGKKPGQKVCDECWRVSLLNMDAIEKLDHNDDRATIPLSRLSAREQQKGKKIA